MKCLNCSAEWTVPQNISRSLLNCPFCGASLKPAAPKSLSTTEDVLQEILQRFGVEALKNGQKLVALFSDLSPQLKRERLLLTYLIQADGNIKLLEACKKTKDEQQACFHQVCKYLIDEQFVAEDAARRICMSYSVAIGLKVSNEKPVTSTNSDSTSGEAVSITNTNSAKPTTSPKPAIQTTYNTQRKPTPPKPVAQSGNANRIDSFTKYQKALEDFYILHGKKTLTYSEIQQFIFLNSLGSWGITVSDVQKDLKDVYAKYTSALSTRDKHQDTMSAMQATHNTQRKPTPPKPVVQSGNANRIDSFAKYQKALEDFYILHGKKTLTYSEIQQFIFLNSLGSWGITVSDVQKDLEDVYLKYTPAPSTSGKHQGATQWLEEHQKKESKPQWAFWKKNKQ